MIRLRRSKEYGTLMFHLRRGVNHESDRQESSSTIPFNGPML